MAINISLQTSSQCVDEGIIERNKGQFFEYISSLKKRQLQSVEYYLEITFATNCIIAKRYNINAGEWVILTSNIHFECFYYKSVANVLLLIVHFRSMAEEIKQHNWCFHFLTNPPTTDMLFKMKNSQNSTLSDLLDIRVISPLTDYYISDDEDIDNPLKDGDYGSESGIDGLCRAKQGDISDDNNSDDGHSNVLMDDVIFTMDAEITFTNTDDEIQDMSSNSLRIEHSSNTSNGISEFVINLDDM